MKRKIIIVLLSCFIVLIVTNGSYAGSLNQMKEQIDNTKDLLIITPDKFENLLQPLADHKEQQGIKTMIVTLETILNHPETQQGRDDAEQMKYYIKYAIEEYSVSYVLLVGGKQGQRPTWYLPVRYVDMDNGWEPHYVSDLYFADIYDQYGEFSSWDSDGDGRFGEWIEGQTPEDKDIDLYPDIALGRLPCRNTKEVEVIVEKIITYETETAQQTRFNTFLTIAGDTYLEISNPLWKGYEGEMFAEYAIENLSGFIFSFF